MAEQTEKAFLKQPKVFLCPKKSGKGKRPGKGGNRYWKSIGLGFKTPREAIQGIFFCYYYLSLISSLFLHVRISKMRLIFGYGLIYWSLIFFGAGCLSLLAAESESRSVDNWVFVCNAIFHLIF
uniref:40S ribosomal protein S11-like n=1 Tax=Rhizophora mucronata TaxID=61149 RepID=A0A2P2M3C4_RHIMU